MAFVHLASNVLLAYALHRMEISISLGFQGGISDPTNVLTQRLHYMVYCYRLLVGANTGSVKMKSQVNMSSFCAVTYHPVSVADSYRLDSSVHASHA
jgi:hypothetical protein